MNKVKHVLVAMALMLAFPAFGEKDIIWDGEWKSGNPIIVCTMDDVSDQLTLDFQKDLGDVVVSIMDASGNILYQEWVQADVNTSVTLSLKGLKTGGGTISVTDGENIVFGTIHL